MGSTAYVALETLVAEAIRLEADALEVEYKGGEEHVFAVKGSISLGMATFPSASPEAVRLREDLVRLHEGFQALMVDGVLYELHCSVSESFGENVYHVELRHVSDLD